MAEPTPRLVADDATFAGLIERLAATERFALDTEFHRERTYFPQVALVQVATDHEVALIDPLSCDLSMLAELFTGDRTVVMHACKQDLEVLDRACGVSPPAVVDTQLAAGFVGYTTPSLASLVDGELGVKLPKSDRLTDWLRRPLNDKQLVYAAADVAHLLPLYDRLRAELESRGRWEWLVDEMGSLMAEPRGARDPRDAWQRIKEVKHLRGVDLAIAQEVAEWRELRAIEMDLTPRHVLGDLGVVGIAVSKPTSAEEMRAIRGVDGRGLRGGAVAELVDLVARERSDRPRRSRSTPLAEVPPQLRPALPLISAWVGQLARDLSIEASLLATRSDLEDLLRGDPQARARSGWREEILGHPVDRLLDGHVALAFDRRSGLVLVDRSG